MSECSFIELAAASLRAGTLQGSGTKAKLTSYHEQALTEDADELPKVLSEHIASLASRVKLSGNVVFGLSSKYLIYRVADFPFSDKKRVARTLPFQIEENLPLAVDEVVIDMFEISRTEEGSKWFACCVPRKLLRAILEACEAARLDPVSVSPSFAGLTDLPERNETSLVIDVGEETTNLLVVANGHIRFCRSLRLAGKTLTRAVADAQSVDLEVAKDIKHGFEGFENGDETLKDIFLNEVSRLVRDTKLTLSTIPSELNPGKLYILGGGMSFDGIDQVLSDKLGMPCESVSAADVMSVPEAVEKPSTTGFVAPTGLAGLENAAKKPVVNFRKEEFAYHGVFDAIAVPLMVMMLLLAAIGGVFAFKFYQLHQNAKKDLNSEYAKLEELWTQVMPENARVPKELSKYSAFIDEYRQELAQEREMRGRFYTDSVLPKIKRVRDFFRNVKLDFKTISIEADENSVRLVIMVHQSESPKVNEALTKARNFFSVNQRFEARPEQMRRYILTFEEKRR